jgi:hypothetical protein
MSEDHRLEVLENIGGDSSEDLLESVRLELYSQISNVIESYQAKFKK